MAYYVEYGPKQPRKSKDTGRAVRVQAMAAAFFLLFAMLVRQFWPEGAEKLRDFLLPGKASVTQAALEDLASEMQDGSDVREALTAFCQQIVDHEQER